jgi:hypothetical protein
MPYSYRIDIDHEVVLFRASGEFSGAEMLACLNEVVASPGFQPSFSHLVDLRDVTDFQATAADMRRRAEADKRMETQIDSGRIALVSSRDSVYGMTRMYEILMDDAPNETRSFASIGDAAEWLGIPQAVAEWKSQPGVGE